MRRLLPAFAVLAAGLLPVVAHGATPSRVSFEDSIPSGSSSSVTIVTHRVASFRVLLRVPTAGRARLYLLGKHAPKGGPLIRTSNTAPTSGCEGAAGSFYCRASFEPLPRGVYTWHVTWRGAPPAPAHVELTVRW